MKEDAPFVCKHCGSPSQVDPSDQSPPPDICHEVDHKSFENWFDNQANNGLVDIHFSVAAGKGVTSDAIKSDLLACEAAIDSGRVMDFPPGAITAIPDDVMAVIRGSRLG